MMNKTLNTITRVLSDHIHRKKGVLKAKHSVNPHTAHFKVKTEQGFSFNIHCEEHCIHVEYSAWWAWPQKRFLYKVYCEFPHDVPFVYQLQMQEIMVFPQLTHSFCSGPVKRKAAIKAYLDIVLQKKGI